MNITKNEIDSVVQEAINLYGKIWMIENELSDALEVYLSQTDVTDRKNFLEIGAAHGASFHILAKWFSNLKISIDLPSTAGSIYEMSAVEKREKLWNSHYSNVHSIIGNSMNEKVIEQLRSVLKDEFLDLLFIDGDHSEEAVRFDYETYGQMVRPGGAILFHDIFMKGFGVHKLWDSIDGEKYSFGKNIGMGLYIKP